MQHVRLRWEGPFDLEDVYNPEFEFFDDCYIYMFLSESEIIYIGKAHYQEMRKRLKQHLSGDDVWKWIRKNFSLKNIRVKVAFIEELGQERMSMELVDDIENLLIVTQQPPANIQKTRTYGGRTLKITNVGDRKPLPRTV